MFLACVVVDVGVRAALARAICPVETLSFADSARDCWGLDRVAIESIVLARQLQSDAAPLPEPLRTKVGRWLKMAEAAVLRRWEIRQQRQQEGAAVGRSSQQAKQTNAGPRLCQSAFSFHHAQLPAKRNCQMGRYAFKILEDAEVKSEHLSICCYTVAFLQKLNCSCVARVAPQELNCQSGDPTGPPAPEHSFGDWLSSSQRESPQQFLQGCQ